MPTYRDFVAEVLGPITRLPVLEVPITASLGTCTAERVAADRPVPGFRQAAVEGVAVVRADAAAASPATPVILPIAERLPAGRPAEDAPVGHCVLVAMGASLPGNTDAVVPVSEVQVDGDKVVLTSPPRAGAGIRGIGSQFQGGDLVVDQGQYLGHVTIAELALIGRPRVLVHPRPRVVVITIGSELVRVSQEATEATVHDAAGVLLTTTAQRLGADCYRVGPIADDARAVRDAVEDQLVRADIVVTVGGIDHPDDVLRAELSQAGLARFDGPSVAPCGAYGVGRVGPDATPIIALPSDPATALLAFHALARPVITAMLGRDEFARPGTIPAPVAVSSGSALIPGRFEADRFVPIAGDPTSLRSLVDVTSVAVVHEGSTVAEVVEWPF